MKPSSAVFSVASVLLFAGLSACEGLQRAQAFPKPNAAAVEKAPHVVPTAGAPSHATSVRNSALGSLPPAGSPFHAVVVDLERRSASGDARASCRLAIEYDACDSVSARYETLKTALAMQKERLKREGKIDQAGASALMATFSDALWQQGEHCGDVKIPPPSRRVQYWRDAAAQGHLPSMVAYSTGRVFRHTDTLSNLDELKIFKQNAEKLAMNAAAAGSLEAVADLAEAYDVTSSLRSRTLLAQAVDQDPKQALIMFRLLQDALSNDNSRAYDRLKKNADRRILDLAESLGKPGVDNVEAEVARRQAAWKPIGAIGSKPTHVMGRIPVHPDVTACESSEFVVLRDAGSL